MGEARQPLAVRPLSLARARWSSFRAPVLPLFTSPVRSYAVCFFGSRRIFFFLLTRPSPVCTPGPPSRRYDVTVLQLKIEAAGKESGVAKRLLESAEAEVRRVEELASAAQGDKKQLMEVLRGLMHAGVNASRHFNREKQASLRSEITTAQSKLSSAEMRWDAVKPRWVTVCRARNVRRRTPGPARVPSFPRRLPLVAAHACAPPASAPLRAVDGPPLLSPTITSSYPFHDSTLLPPTLPAPTLSVPRLRRAPCAGAASTA